MIEWEARRPDGVVLSRWIHHEDMPVSAPFELSAVAGLIEFWQRTEPNGEWRWVRSFENGVIR